MAKFVTGKELEDVVYDIIFQAKHHLVLISPYIKLDQYFKKLLEKHLSNPDLELVVVFGKNERDVSRSVSPDDLDYFCGFPNVTLIYVANLHAKYYGNETKGVITSINLYDYSFKNNIEFGVYTEYSELMNKLSGALNKKTLDDEAFEGAMRVANEHNVVFAKRPVYKKRTLGKLLGNFLGGRDFMNSRVLFDHVEDLLDGRRFESKKRADFPTELDIEHVSETIRPTRAQVEENRQPFGHTSSRTEASWQKQESGYCIRTGASIPFNPDRPLSYESYKIWAEYGDVDYPEKYCHKTGRPSYGKTSMRNPIL